MKKWRRFLNILLTAVICFVMGMVPGRRVCAEAAEACGGEQIRRISSDGNGRYVEKIYSLENEKCLNNDLIVKCSGGTDSLQRKRFYWMRGPGDWESLHFSDSG